MAMPNFLVIGAPKSGTTSLHNYLSQHPDIYMSSAKEPHFFAFVGGIPDFRGPDDENLRGITGTPERLQNQKYKNATTDEQDYRRLFDGVRTEKAVGESSVGYMYFPESADLIRDRLPGAKLIAILRNPVDRAYSKFQEMRKFGCEPLKTFEEALEAEDSRIERGWSPTWHYKRRGFYHDQLKRYCDRFASKQIKVLLYDKFAANPDGVLQEIFAFLGVDDTFLPDTTQRHMVTEGSVQKLRSHLLHNFMEGDNPLKSAVKGVIPSNVRKWMRTFVLKQNVKEEAWEGLPSMPPAIRAKLLDEYRQDILQLQSLIEIDLSPWLSPAE